MQVCVGHWLWGDDGYIRTFIWSMYRYAHRYTHTPHTLHTHTERERQDGIRQDHDGAAGAGILLVVGIDRGKSSKKGKRKKREKRASAHDDEAPVLPSLPPPHKTPNTHPNTHRRRRWRRHHHPATVATTTTMALTLTAPRSWSGCCGPTPCWRRLGTPRPCEMTTPGVLSFDGCVGWWRDGQTDTHTPTYPHTHIPKHPHTTFTIYTLPTHPYIPTLQSPPPKKAASASSRSSSTRCRRRSTSSWGRTMGEAAAGSSGRTAWYIPKECCVCCVISCVYVCGGDGM